MRTPSDKADLARREQTDRRAIPASIRHSTSAFTLVEMIVVMAVIVILVSLVVPAATTMWNQRKIADAHNSINGILRTTRAKAAQGRLGDAGVLFYLDDRGIQHAATIARIPLDPDAAQPDGPAIPWQSDPNWRDVYTVVPGRTQALPAGMRVVPQYALIDQQQANDANPPLASHQWFSNDELANEEFENLAADGDQGQRQRNHFAVLFSADGRLMTDRNVLVRDVDLDDDDPGKGKGDITGLPVHADTATPLSRYYDRKQSGPQTFDNNYTLPDFLVIPGEGQSVAACFAPVDGLLVYDDALFKEAATPADKRQFLRDQGQPFYVHHLTGAIVKGPTGENLGP